MSKKVGIGYSFKEKSIEKENEELKKAIVILNKENKELKNRITKLKEKETKEPTVAELKAKLDELGIEYDKKATKEVLLTLIPQE
jgi:hypothetical protein